MADPAFMRYKLTIAFDGTDYAGWQVQPGHRTIQGEIENAFRKMTGERVIVHGSGRTDQGVHAVGQVAHADLSRDRPCRDIQKALNALLNDDIRIMKVSKTRADFHARRSAASKEYRYFIWNGETLPPTVRRYRCHFRKPLDVKAMRMAASFLEGRRDFASFTANANREVESTVRHLVSLKIARRGNEVVIAAKGDGFLYKMVRSLAGFLLRVGEGALSPSEAKTILNSGIRTARVPTAPPQGLFLWRVTY
jgi:tRNA pseudouridine38-40 synthase